MEVAVERGLLEEMLRFAGERYPNEAILILRGNASKESIEITDYLFPPMGWGDPRFAGFPLHMLPMDLSYMGTLHSHPSGNINPSVQDIHGMFGRVMLIVGPPFGLDNVAAYRKDAEKLPVRVT
jgi:proteasome lid subunit RPN8/RPN11